MNPSPDARPLASGAVALCLALGSCASPEVELATRPLTDSAALATLLRPDRLTDGTRRYLEREGIDRTFRKDPEAAIVAVRERLSSAPSETGRTALFELCSNQGDRLAAEDPLRAAGYHLAAADAAWTALTSGEAPPDGDAGGNELLEAYNHSAGQVARLLANADHPWGQPAQIVGPGTTYRLATRNRGPGLADPAFFDAIVPSEYIVFRDIDLERIRRDGWGGALVGRRDATPERRRTDPFLPPAGMALPLNATLEFSDGGGEVALAFHDLTLVEKARVGARTVPLAADLTAPLATLYNFAPKHNVGWRGMLHPDEYADWTGLFQIEPFRPDQIPVVFVHGLMSSPRTWAEAVNRLQSDARLRERYQFLFFYYPTGFPIVYNAAALRRALAEYRRTYDPEGNHPTMREMVLVGHSMGGLLTNAQIRDSGDTYLDKLFTRPIDEIDGLDETQKVTFEELLTYGANPDITRAVFVAAPHRGSDLAKGWLGELGSRLIRFPMKILSVEPLRSVDGMTDLAREVVSHRPDSIIDLEPRAPVLMTVLEQPVRGGIVLHSVIGRHHPDAPLPESSDKVVPYWSSHLDDVASEKVVHATHTTITGNPEAIEEIRRILYLHAGLGLPVRRAASSDAAQPSASRSSASSFP